jgi:hypothetical protein
VVPDIAPDRQARRRRRRRHHGDRPRGQQPPKPGEGES